MKTLLAVAIIISVGISAAYAQMLLLKVGSGGFGGSAPVLTNLRITNTGDFRVTNTGDNRAVFP